MSVLISDASVLIDVCHGDITECMFSLPYQFEVPDLLYAQELSQQHSQLLDLGLVRKVMSSELLEKVDLFSKQYFKTSFYDLLALTLAQYKNCPLLTGDKWLRKVAKVFDVKVHGTIWLVEQMLKQKIISYVEAKAAFLKMEKFKSRLPNKEVQSLLKKFE